MRNSTRRTHFADLISLGAITFTRGGLRLLLALTTESIAKESEKRVLEWATSVSRLTMLCLLLRNTHRVLELLRGSKLTLTDNALSEATLFAESPVIFERVLRHVSSKRTALIPNRWPFGVRRRQMVFARPVILNGSNVDPQPTPIERCFRRLSIRAPDALVRFAGDFGLQAILGPCLLGVGANPNIDPLIRGAALSLCSTAEERIAVQEGMPPVLSRSQEYPLDLSQHVLELSVRYEFQPASHGRLEFGSVRAIQNAELWFGNLVLTNDSLIVTDQTADPRVAFVAGLWDKVWGFASKGNVCVVRRPQERVQRIETGILLGGRVDENWYHWLIDTLPRLSVTENVSEEVPLLIRKAIPQSAKDLLSRVSSRAVIEIPDDSAVAVGELFLIPGRSSTFDTGAVPLANSFKLQEAGLLWLRSQTDFERCGPLESERLVLSRSQATRSLAPKRLISYVASRRGYRVVDTGEMSLESQIRIFGAASGICSPSGAALANMLFMSEGSEVVIASSAQVAEWQGWKKLAQLFSINVVHVRGFPLTLSPKKSAAIHSRVLVNPLRFIPR